MGRGAAEQLAGAAGKENERCGKEIDRQGVTEEISRARGRYCTEEGVAVCDRRSREGAEIRRVGKYRVRREGWARRGAVGDGGGTWRVGSCAGVRCGQEGSIKMVERGEDECHLPRREYIGRQTDVRNGVRFCFTCDRGPTAGDTDGIATVVRSSRVR